MKGICVVFKSRKVRKISWKRLLKKLRTIRMTVRSIAGYLLPQKTIKETLKIQAHTESFFFWCYVFFKIPHCSDKSEWKRNNLNYMIALHLFVAVLVICKGLYNIVQIINNSIKDRLSYILRIKHQNWSVFVFVSILLETYLTVLRLNI